MILKFHRSLQWIVSQEYLLACQREHDLVPEDDFEIKGACFETKYFYFVVVDDGDGKMVFSVSFFFFLFLLLLLILASQAKENLSTIHLNELVRLWRCETTAASCWMAIAYVFTARRRVRGFF